jgi:hypothetical protein
MIMWHLDGDLEIYATDAASSINYVRFPDADGEVSSSFMLARGRSVHIQYKVGDNLCGKAHPTHRHIRCPSTL